MNCPRCDKTVARHTASRETDACVHVVVMGRHLKPDYAKCLDNTHCDCWPRYSKDIGDAWEVAQKFDYHEWYGDTKNWNVYLQNGGWGEADAPTLELAICRAALKSAAST